MPGQWFGARFQSDILKNCEKGLERAAIHFVNSVKEAINRSQNYRRYVGKIVSYKGLNPSEPGTPPKKLTGVLQRSITWNKISPEKVIAGSNIPYAEFLELGTSKMAARPFLRYTLIRESQKLGELVLGDNR